jgi:hypothetical protein
MTESPDPFAVAMIVFFVVLKVIVYTYAILSDRRQEGDPDD